MPFEVSDVDGKLTISFDKLPGAIERINQEEVGVSSPFRICRLLCFFRDHRYAREPVSYTHLRAHETVLDLVCRLLLEKKQKSQDHISYCFQI